jgi:hypothetical protein
MHTNDDDKLLFKEEVFRIVGCAIEVLNTLGHGLVAKPYENALVVEFGLQEIPFQQQPAFDVLYKGHKVGPVCSRSHRVWRHRCGRESDRPNP